MTKTKHVLIASMLIAWIFLCTLVSAAQSNPPVTWIEADGSPKRVNPTKIIFPNGSLSMVGGSITVSFTGVVDGSGAATQFDSTNETPANITDLTRNVEAGKSYSFEVHLRTTSDVGGGVKVEISGTATATAIGADIFITNAGLTTQGRVTALDSSVGVTAVTVAAVIIKGTITVNAGGTLTIQASRNAAVGTTSVLVGSYFRLIPD